MRAVRQAIGDGPELVIDANCGWDVETAIGCIRELAEAWEETEGYVDWMFQEYFMWEKEKMKRLRDRKRKQRKKSSSQKKRRR